MGLYDKTIVWNLKRQVDENTNKIKELNERVSLLEDILEEVCYILQDLAPDKVDELARICNRESQTEWVQNHVIKTLHKQWSEQNYEE